MPIAKVGLKHISFIDSKDGGKHVPHAVNDVWQYTEREFHRVVVIFSSPNLSCILNVLQDWTTSDSEDEDLGPFNLLPFIS